MNAFRAAVEAKDVDAALALLDEHVVFRSPAVFKPYAGKEITSVILRAVFRVIQDFRYETEIGADGAADHVLVFKGEVDGREIHGADFLHTNDAGLIDEFTVMIRPLSALTTLAAAMGVEIDRVMAQAAAGQQS